MSHGDDAWKRTLSELGRGALSSEFEAQWRRFQEAYRDRPEEEGPPPAWWPAADWREQTNLGRFIKELGYETYPELHHFSATDRAAFWQRVIERLGIVFDRQPERTLDLRRGVEHPRWLPGARMNAAESCFVAEPDQTAVVWAPEEQDGEGVRRVSYRELLAWVNRVANGLVENGFRRGDAIALYLPMTFECVAAYLGIVSAGCRGSSIADSFGIKSTCRESSPFART